MLVCRFTWASCREEERDIVRHQVHVLVQVLLQFKGDGGD